MKILKDRLKQLIREEMVNFPLLFEGPPKSAKLQAYEARWPGAKNNQLNALLSKLVQQQAPIAQQWIHNIYFKNFSSFARFIRSLKGYEKEPLENIKKNYKEYLKAVVSALSSTPTLMFYDDIEQIPLEYIEGNVGGYYDTDLKKIFMNPHIYISKKTGKINHAQIVDDLKEEYIHAAQAAIRRSKLEMPIAAMQTRAAKNAGIILPREKTGLDKKTYEYWTRPIEFHAKMFRLKSNLRKRDPSSFNEQGQIKKEVLRQLMSSENPPGVLQVIDPTKLDELWKFFNMVARAPAVPRNMRPQSA